MRRRAPILFALAALACCSSLAGPAAAHTGGPLDDDGCHGDRRRGNFHCHRGPARGYEFRSRAAMKEAVESGNLAERPADTEGFLRKLWPFGKHEETSREPPSPQAVVEAEAEVATPTAAPSANEANAATTAVEPPTAAPASASVPEKTAPPTKPASPPALAAPLPSKPPAVAPAAPSPPTPAETIPVERSVRSYEERLRTLEGLRDRGVITGEEYEARRKAILDEI